MHHSELTLSSSNVSGDKDMGQHWLRLWLFDQRYLAITWINVDLSRARFYGIHKDQFYRNCRYQSNRYENYIYKKYCYISRSGLLLYGPNTWRNVNEENWAVKSAHKWLFHYCRVGPSPQGGEIRLCRSCWQYGNVSIKSAWLYRNETDTLQWKTYFNMDFIQLNKLINVIVNNNRAPFY